MRRLSTLTRKLWTQGRCGRGSAGPGSPVGQIRTVSVINGQTVFSTLAVSMHITPTIRVFLRIASLAQRYRRALRRLQGPRRRKLRLRRLKLLMRKAQLPRIVCDVELSLRSTVTRRDRDWIIPWLLRFGLRQRQLLVGRRLANRFQSLDLWRRSLTYQALRMR